MNKESRQVRRGVTSEPVSYSILVCNWQALRTQLLLQWTRLSARDLDVAGPNCRRIARLIESKYGIGSDMMENYLRNFEKTLPLR